MNIKKKLKIVGLLIILGAFLSSFITPFFFCWEKRHPHMSTAEISRAQKQDEKNARIQIGIQFFILGAGIAILIAGFAINKNQIHNKKNPGNGVPPHLI